MLFQKAILGMYCQENILQIALIIQCRVSRLPISASPAKSLSAQSKFYSIQTKYYPSEKYPMVTELPALLPIDNIVLQSNNFSCQTLVIYEHLNPSLKS